MAIHLEFDADCVARVIASGQVSIDEAIGAVEELYADDRFVPPTRLLWDLRSGQVDFSTADIRKLAGFVSENRPEGLGRAAVVATDDLSFGLSRMYGLLADHNSVEVNVFRTVEPALRWLREDF